MASALSDKSIKDDMVACIRRNVDTVFTEHAAEIAQIMEAAELGNRTKVEKLVRILSQHINGDARQEILRQAQSALG